MFNKTMIPLDLVHVHRVGSVAEWVERRNAINHKYAVGPDCWCEICVPRAKVFKSACQVFGKEHLDMRSVLGIPQAA